MKWSIKQIEETNGLPLVFSDAVDVKALLMERESEIIDVSIVQIKGTLLYDNHSVVVNYQIDVTVTLPSSRSLEPVDVALQIDVYERFVEEGYLSQYVDVSKDEVVTPLSEPYVHLEESIVDSILLNLPMQVLSDAEQNDTEPLPSGEGWVVYTEDTYNEQKKKEAYDRVDPRFAGLKTLLIDENHD